MKWHFAWHSSISVISYVSVTAGYAAGPIHNQGGGGSNFLCLPEEPQWKTYLTGDHTSGTIAGVEYELFNSGIYHNNVFSESNNGGNPLVNNPAPCAVCYVQGRSTILMIPARTVSGRLDHRVRRIPGFGGWRQKTKQLHLLGRGTGNCGWRTKPRSVCYLPC